VAKDIEETAIRQAADFLKALGDVKTLSGKVRIT
jgi:hypothetical protein